MFKKNTVYLAITEGIPAFVISDIAPVLKLGSRHVNIVISLYITKPREIDIQDYLGYAATFR